MTLTALDLAAELIAGASLRELELTALDLSLRTDLTRTERAELTAAIQRRALALDAADRKKDVSQKNAPDSSSLDFSATKGRPQPGCSTYGVFTPLTGATFSGGAQINPLTAEPAPVAPAGAAGFAREVRTLFGLEKEEI